MTQEEKAQAYDKAIEVIRKCETDKYGCVIGIKPSDIFQELQESEDEKTRKEITEFFKNYSERGTWKAISDVKRWVAFLEKQGKQNSNEPKFKVGDWVVNKFGDSWHIDSFDKKNYQVSDGKGNYNYFPISKQDEMHLWTIEDAKDDDVLADEDNNIGIYRGKVDDVDWHSCIYLGCDNYLRGSGYHIIKNTNPATKEQRDQLEKAIADADFTFGFEKKELKKIEEKPEWSEEDEKRVESLHGWLDTLVNYIHDDAIVSLDLRRERMQQVERLKTWLEFLKDRVGNFDNGYKVGFSAAKHNQWKPSDVQMKLLKEACDQHWEPDGLDPLYTLYQDLKKLKG